MAKRKFRSQQLRDRVLQERGLAKVRPEVQSRKQVRLGPRPDRVPDRLKTYAMKMVEMKAGKPIEIILVSGSVRQIERKYGVDSSTVCRWRNKLSKYLHKEEPCDQDSDQESW